MKKLLNAMCLGAVLALGLWGFVKAGDVQRFVSPTSGSEIYALDDSGNVDFAGSATVAGTLAVTGAQTVTGVTNSAKTILTPTSVSVSTKTSISPSATYMLAITTGISNVTLSNDLAFGPAISTTSATTGQLLILGSTTSVTTVSLATGTANGILGIGETFIVLSSTKAPVALIYNGTLKLWNQLTKQ